MYSKDNYKIVFSIKNVRVQAGFLNYCIIF